MRGRCVDLRDTAGNLVQGDLHIDYARWYAEIAPG